MLTSLDAVRLQPEATIVLAIKTSGSQENKGCTLFYVNLLTR